MALKNLTVRIPDVFRGVVLTVWQKMKLRLGKPVFITLPPGGGCIVFIEGGRFKYKCDYSSVDEARKGWRLRLKGGRGGTPLPVSPSAAVTPAVPIAGVLDELEENDEDGSSDGSGAPPASGGNSGRRSGPKLVPRPGRNIKPAEDKKKDKKAEEPEPHVAPSHQGPAPDDEPYITEPQESEPDPAVEHESVPDTQRSRIKRRL